MPIALPQDTQSVFIITHQHYKEHMLAVVTDVINCMLVMGSLQHTMSKLRTNTGTHIYCHNPNYI